MTTEEKLEMLMELVDLYLEAYYRYSFATGMIFRHDNDEVERKKWSDVVNQASPDIRVAQLYLEDAMCVLRGDEPDGHDIPVIYTQNQETTR